MAKLTKLTLTLKKELIERAKKYAQAHNRSLSNLIEEYLRTITEADKETGIELTSLVKSLKGSVKVPEAGAIFYCSNSDDSSHRLRQCDLGEASPSYFALSSMHLRCWLLPSWAGLAPPSQRSCFL